MFKEKKVHRGFKVCGNQNCGKKKQQRRQRVVGSCSSSPPSTLDGTGNTRVLSLDWREVFLQVTNLNTDAPHTLFFFFFCTPPTLTAPE